jgi:hypothetical protein
MAVIAMYAIIKVSKKPPLITYHLFAEIITTIPRIFIPSILLVLPQLDPRSDSVYKGGGRGDDRSVTRSTRPLHCAALMTLVTRCDVM